jgi:hypothetical protein
LFAFSSLAGRLAGDRERRTSFSHGRRESAFAFAAAAERRRTSALRLRLHCRKNGLSANRNWRRNAQMESVFGSRSVCSIESILVQLMAEFPAKETIVFRPSKKISPSVKLEATAPQTAFSAQRSEMSHTRVVVSCSRWRRTHHNGGLAATAPRD